MAEGSEAAWTCSPCARAEALQAMPPAAAAVDQVRFQDIAVVATAADGSRPRQVLGADELGALGARRPSQFEIAAPGQSVRELAIAFPASTTCR